MILGRRASFLVVVIGAAVVPALIASLGWGAWGSILGVPAVPEHHFLDLLAVIGRAPCVAQGVNVYVQGDCDPWGRPFNLPPVWLLLDKLGLTYGAARWLAPLFEVSAVVVFAALMRGRTATAGVAALAALLSPSVMLAFERGNVDLIIFVLVGSAALLLAGETRARLVASFGLLALAVVGKLYPIFCCAAAVRSSRLALLAGALLLFGGIYLISIADYLPLMRHNNDVSPYFSYSYLVPFLFVEQVVAPRLGFPAPGLSASAAPTVVAAIWCAIVAGGSVALWRRGAQFCSLATGTAAAAFTFGAAIYCGSFLFMYINYAYRLVFLLLCLPQLFDWVGGPSTEFDGTRKAGWGLLVLLYFLLWCALVGDRIWLAISLCQYLLFAGLGGVVLLNGLRRLPSRLTRIRVKILIE